MTRSTSLSTSSRQKAVIYCRVSDTKQTIRGNGLGSQETRCRLYAEQRDYQVVEVFQDDFTGATSNRPGMNALLAFLRRQKASHVVIIDDISRLARDVEAHAKLRRTIKKAGGYLTSPSMEFKDDPDARFVENVLASSAQHMREKNAEQTLNRMRARALQGYWSFWPPVGYRYEKVAGHGKLLVPQEPLASIVREAFEGYASGRFQTQAEVMRFLEARPEFPRPAGTIVRNNRITQLLTQWLYAGYFELPRWDIGLTQGKHEPLISVETFQVVQERLKGIARVPARKDLHADFPLRGAVCCADCGHQLTGCWSKGSHASYAYYLCYTRGCPSKGKSIRKEKVEGEFSALLQRLQPTPHLFTLAHSLFRDLWDDRVATAKSRAKGLELELKKTEQSVALLVDKLIETDSATLSAVYENRIKALEEKKAELREGIDRCGRPAQSFDQTFRTAMGFLANPYKLWISERIEDRRAVLKLCFVDRLAYSRSDGFRTPLTSSPFRALSDFSDARERMARPKRFELLTPRFVVWCSIQLSYGRAC